MDKLKQVQKYQFWILLGVAIILPLVGWYLATSGLAAETAKRTDDLKKIDGDLKASPDDPNEKWKQAVDEFNKVQQGEFLVAWRELYERQKPLMTWHPDVDPDNLEELTGREQMRKEYSILRRKVWQLVRPVDENGENGLVDFSESLLPHPEEGWGGTPPLGSEVAEIQEDLWLIAAVLKAINQVNESADATSMLDAPIRAVVDFYLRGGSTGKAGSKAPAGGSKTTNPGSAGAGMAGAMAEMGKSIMAGNRSNTGLGGAMGLSESGGGSSGFDNNVSFNPDDELGPEVEQKSDVKAKTTTTASGGGDKSGAGAAMSEMLKSRGSNNASSGAKMERYVEKKGDIWKTRGFYLELIMDHRRVPDLLAALSSSEWPIRILRVHQADLKGAELYSEGEAGGGMAMGNMPGGGAGGVGGAAGGMAAAMGSKMMAAKGGGGMAGPGMAPGMTGGGGKSRRPRTADVDGETSDLGGETSGSPRGGQALEDPMLANVAIDGLITIFNPPPAEEAGAQGQGNAPAGDATTGNGNVLPADAAEAAAEETEADAAEGEEMSADEEEAAETEAAAPDGAEPDAAEPDDPLDEAAEPETDAPADE